MRITVLAVGRIKAPYVDDTAHYRKLLGRYAKLEFIQVKEERDLRKRLPGDAFTCLLDRDGRSFSSMDFSRFLQQRRVSGQDLCFLIGGPKGLNDREAVGYDLLLSFGPQTLPHQLAQVLLLEQLYRAHKILAGEPYHY